MTGPVRVYLVILLLGLVVAVNLSASAPLVDLLWWGLLGALALPVAQTAVKAMASHRQRFAKFEPALALVTMLIASWVVWGPVLEAGHLTDTKDHHVMMERARELSRALWSGRIQRYTHLLQGGDALWDLYPVLPSLLVAAVDAVLPSRVTFEQSYSIVTLATWTLRGLAVYGLCRRVASVLPALLVTIGCQLDVGFGVWDSTWSAAIHWGLVHSSLGVTFGALAAAAGIDVVRRASIGRMWRCAGWVTLGLLSHPLAFFYIAFSGACFAVAALGQRLRARRLLATLGAIGFGCVLGAWYFVPYSVGLSNLGVRFAWPGDNFGVLGLGVLQGTKPFGDFGGFYGFAAVACCASLITKAAVSPSSRLLLRSQGAVSLLLFCLMISPLAIQAQLYELVPPLRGLQPPRLFSVLKVSLVPALAWGVERLIAHLKVPGTLDWRPVLYRAFMGTLLIFGIGHMLNNSLASLRDKLRDQVVPAALTTPPAPLGSEVDDDLNTTMKWIAEQRAKDPSPTPFRMATLWNGWDSWGLWWYPWRINVPLVHLEALPGNFLKFRPQHVSAECLSQWNVRYVVLRTPTVERKPKPPFPELHRRFTVGRYHVFELKNYDPRYVLLGATDAKISGLVVAEDRVEFDIAGASGETPVVVRTAWFPRWRASLDGSPLTVTQVNAHADAVNESQVGLLARNGHVVLTCDGNMPTERAAIATSGLGFAAGLSFGNRRLRRRFSRSFARFGVFIYGLRTRLVSRLTVRPRWKWLALSLFCLVVIGGTRLVRARHLRLPGMLGNTASFAINDQSGARWPCVKTPFSGTYVCGAGGTGEPIQNRFGRTVGHMGEFPPLWPGIGVPLPVPGRTLEARFQKIAPGRQLVLKYDASAPVILEATYRGIPLARQELNAYWGEVALDLPVANGNDELVLSFGASVPGVQLVFAAETR